MSALPGHDRMAEDEKRAEAASCEHDGPTLGNVGPGRDIIAELIEACAVPEPTNRDD